MITRGLDIAGRESKQVTLSSEQVQALDARLAGKLLREGDEGWDEAVTIWNAMAAKRPALVAQPVSPQDVAAVVAFARDQGLLLSVKGGGHNIAGTSIAERGVMLDMSQMRGVTVDPAKRLVHVGPGCRLRDVDRATQEHGLATTLGFVSKTGVAGLTLGGGFGYLARRFGWAADNLEEVQIVTADGRILTANREEHADLFWAVRGGGGNFGVVTRFTYRLHAVGPMITGGMMAWSADRADAVLQTYLDLTASAPRELTVALASFLAPPAPFITPEWHGKPIIALLICHSGANPAADLAPLRAIGQPIVDLVTEKPYVDQQSMVDDMEPDGVNQYWKTEFLPGMSREYLDIFLARALKVTSPLSLSVVFPIGGAINERADDDGAVGNRDAQFISGFSGAWPPGTLSEKHIAWVRESWEAIRPFSTGGNYVNFQLAEDDEARTASAYGRNFRRLQQVKAAYDPDNLFRVNRNIPPAA